MKIGIFTFHSAINYGAVLQAYALQEYLKSLGHNVSIIDYRPSYIQKSYRLINREFAFKMDIKWLIREMCVIPIRLKRRHRFNLFRQTFLNVELLDLNSSDNDFDVFVFGSDQIWNPNITAGLDPVFWGEARCCKNKECIAYAASAGHYSNISNTYVQNMKKFLINNFIKVSVREDDLLSFREDSVSIQKTIDPVLLAGNNVFNRIVSIPKEKNYLLLYMLTRDEDAVTYARNLAQTMDLSLIEIVSTHESLFGKHLKQALSPNSFLGYIKEASFVVTTSFHGTAFSVLFNKQFSTITKGVEIGARAYDLLKSLGLESRIVDLSCYDSVDLSYINYDVVNHRLEELRKQSKDFLDL